MNGNTNNAGKHPEQIPESVQFYVKHALNVLREQEAALHGVQLARGNGHILALELQDREAKIKQAMDRLGEFRARAANNGVDAEAFIQTCGGVPDFERFGYAKPEGGKLPEHEYAFDCTLTAAIRVKGDSREAAEAHLLAAMDAADCNGGAWPNGDPITFEASVNDSHLALYEVDGEPVVGERLPEVIDRERHLTTASWIPVSEPPALLNDPSSWPASKPVLGYCVDGEIRIVTCERFDEDHPLQWYSKCSERWNMTDKVLSWMSLPAAPKTP
ncbi:hypothetical protein P3T23_008771 [Paraburkholderia sp. GAS448]|uniref:hypothetical protein n=1 Tax=Paraburkholderia sp. GAS448 TaxID=3035136 RepID=UPI003D246203